MPKGEPTMPWSEQRKPIRWRLVFTAAVGFTLWLLLVTWMSAQPSNVAPGTKVVPTSAPIALQRADVLAFLAPGASSDPPADICTGPYFYVRNCDQNWNASWGTGGFPGTPPGSTSQGCSAHTWIIKDELWFEDGIINQHPATGGFKKSPTTIGGGEWNKCFVPPHVGLPSSYRCSTTIPPGGSLVYAMKTWSQITNPGQKAAYGGLYGCSAASTPTKTPTKTPTATGPTPTPTPNPYANWIYKLRDDGVTSGCGNGDYCPTAPLTREQAAVWMLKIKYGSGFVPPPCQNSPGVEFNDVPCP